MYPGLADVDNERTLVDGAYGVAVEVNGGCGHDFSWDSPAVYSGGGGREPSS